MNNKLLLEKEKSRLQISYVKFIIKDNDFSIIIIIKVNDKKYWFYFYHFISSKFVYLSYNITL